jgi:hypothetical protein
MAIVIDRYRPSALSPATARSASSRQPQSTAAMPFVLVGGVPGAGKTTALAVVAELLPEVKVVDPERHRDRFAAALPGVPYRVYRPLVHLLHAAAVLWLLLAGPARLQGRALVVHEPGTRPRRNAFLASLARARGWQPMLFVVDVSARDALAGQHARGRVLHETSFTGHWARWTSQRPALLDAAAHGAGMGSWGRVVVVDRADAAASLAHLLSPADAATSMRS